MYIIEMYLVLCLSNFQNLNCPTYDMKNLYRCIFSSGMSYKHVSITTEFLEFMYYVLPVQRSITDHTGFFPVFDL